MTDAEKFDYILQHFKVSRRYQNKAQCICPSHNDKMPSLTISMGYKGVLVHCHVGCSCQDVITSAGLKMSDLFYDRSDRT